jgi:HD-like signal output (HDOD) protein
LCVCPWPKKRMECSAMKKSILFVDDEPNVLEGLQRLLRSKREEWDMAFIGGGAQALALVKTRHFDVIVSDMRMPGMDGNQLLSAVMEQSPDTIRFILSGHADQELIYKSIGSTHQYMSKPCEAEVLINTIERAFAIRDLLKKDALKKLVTHIRVIPSLPDLYIQVVNELKSPNASTSKVGQIISKDIGMSAKVLQLVNSAFFGLRRHVDDPAQAASLLGLDILKSLVLMVQVFSQMEKITLQGYSLEALWAHSLLVGRCCQSIARQTHSEKKAVDDAFMAGLFHDLGKVVLIANMPDKYKQVINLVTNKYMKVADAERQVFEGTHEEVGAYLLGLWGFSDPVVEATAYHHVPSSCVGQKFSALTTVHVANAVLNEMESHHSNAVLSTLDMPYLERIGITNSLPEWRSICASIYEQGEKAGGKDTVRG